MLRNLPNPLHSRVIHGNVGVEPPGHGPGDERRALLLQESEEPPLLLDEGVDPGGFAVEEGGDGALGADIRYGNHDVFDGALAQPEPRDAVRAKRELITYAIREQCVVEE